MELRMRAGVQGRGEKNPKIDRDGHMGLQRLKQSPEAGDSGALTEAYSEHRGGLGKGPQGLSHSHSPPHQTWALQDREHIQVVGSQLKTGEVKDPGPR